MAKKQKLDRSLVFILAVVLIVTLSVIYAAATGYTTSQPSHTVLYTDTLRGKSGANVNVDDNLCIKGDCISSWPEGYVSSWLPGMHCGIYLNSRSDGVQVVNCEGMNPQTGCPAGFQRVSAYFEDGHAGRVTTCIKT